METTQPQFSEPSRKQRDPLQAGGFRIAEHQVHVLHGLAGRPHHQVVERRTDNRPSRNSVGYDSDECHVGAAHLPSNRGAQS